MLQKEKIKKEQENLKQRRQDRINNGKNIEELYSIKKNLYLHKTLYTIMSIFNSTYKKDFEKTYFDFGKRPIIFAPNHVRMQDIAIEMEAVRNHMVLLSGDFENVHPDISGKLLEKNGIIYFDMENPYNTEELKKDRKYLKELEEYIKLTDSKDLKNEYEKELNLYNDKVGKIINDRKNVKYAIKNVLDACFNMLWYYEGSWNLSENKPYYDGYNYIVQAAIDSNAIVVPISFDLINQENSKKRKACVRFGNPIDYRKIYGNKILTKEEKCEALDILKGEIGGKLYDIWEENSYIKRDDLAKKYYKEDYFTPDYKRKSPLYSYWQEYIDIVLKEWKFSIDDIEKKHFVDKDVLTSKEAFKHLDELNLNKNNAFLISKRNHF